MRHGSLSVVVMVAGLSAPALAQSRPMPEPPLAGPRVREQRVPGVEQGFSEGRREAGPARREMMIPHRVFMQIIGALRGDGEHPAPEELRLTPEQDRRIAEIDREFRDRAREFAGRDRGDEPPAARRRERGPADGGAPAGRPGEPMDERAAPPAGPGLRGRIEAFRRDGPSPADAQTRIYAELDDRQREFVRHRLGEFREQMEERFGEAYLERRLRQRGATPPPSPDRPGADRPGPGGPEMARPGEGPEGLPRERVRRIIEKLSQLPPEERERILARVEAALDQRLSGSEGRWDHPPAPPQQPDQPPRRRGPAR